MENLNNEKPPLPPPRKYVSIFRINGEPILPPLMTTEKRRQMQNLKEKALKIEQKLKECKQRTGCENNQNNEDMNSDNSCSKLHHTLGNVSQRSQDYYESKLKETEESMILLKNLIQRQEGGSETKLVETVNSACNTSTDFHRNTNQEKLQKLQKSEILIYDNSTNEVIQVPAENENNLVKYQQRKPREMELQKNFTHVAKEKSSHLLLAGVNSKGATVIPSICLNPPTPLSANRSLCEILSTTESTESLLTSEIPNKSLDFSSDESFNSMITQSDKKSNRNKCQNIRNYVAKTENYKNAEVKTIAHLKTVCKKIQQFEAISSDTNTPQTSPEKVYKSRKTCLGTPMGTMSRSATSPSIKLITSNRSSSSRSQSLAQDSDNLPENTLVRSSSFTLEGPSKALIEHMQQQKVISDSKVVVKCINAARNLPTKTISSTLRAHRDTVESKAKRVQKVELKSSKQKIQQKASQSKLAQAAAATTSPYNSIAPTHHINGLCKAKRSPYNITKSSHTSLQTLPKTSSSQMRKSNSTSSNFAQTKTSNSKLTSSTLTSCNSEKIPHTGKELYNKMDKAQKEKFLHLLAQQEEEQQRLQQSFEMQQKLLIEELNREMAALQLKSLNKSPQHKKQSQLNSTGSSLEQSSHKPTSGSCDLKQNKTQPNQFGTSPPSISNNSSYISDHDQSQSHILSSQNSSLYVSNCSQLSQPISLNNSNLSLMDQSNANTSLDISTLSTQTSPDTLYKSTTIQNNTTHDVIGNKTTPLSTSRRRLFETEINNVVVDGDGDVNSLTSRSKASSMVCSSGLHILEQEHQPQTMQTNYIHKSSIAVTSDNNGHLPADDFSIMHAAATKINAYARGFLVRRLFQTEQIQRIVQTIRDTLIFVLSLHIETVENPKESYTPANIKLKARLLQQLKSASRTLYLIFFQTSIKERMEVIARDRKRIKTKLMSMNHKSISRTPRIAG